MVFQVPQWDDGNPKSRTVIINKHAAIKVSPKNKAGTVNNVADKSKLLTKKSKKAIQKKNKTNSKRDNTTINGSQAENNKSPKKLDHQNGVSSNCISPIKKNKKNVSKCSPSNRDNIDVEKLDEAILNAKKKKFNEALEKDDVEHLLFTENVSPKIKTNDNKVNNTLGKKNFSKVHNEENKKVVIKNGKNLEVIKKKQKQNKTLNNKILKAKNAGDKTVKLNSETAKAKNDKTYNDTQNSDSELNENDSVNGHFINTHTPKHHINDKKEKLKKLLQQTNRSPINMNRNKLRERMMDRLKSAQFRFLNEKLYTSSGTEASQLFQSDPAAFTTYHQGYQQQLKKWPINPLDVIVKKIRKMPKSHLIADMGCGEASLAKRVPNAVRSFDLVSTAPGVEVCDMAHTPLLAESMDVVVYCLALMGTDLTGYLVEANRVLKTGGHLLIAEVESRFADVNEFTKSVQKLGFKVKAADTEHDVFLFMEFTKTTSAPLKKAKQPVLTLKPCIYKRR